MSMNAKQLELNLIPNVQTTIINFVKECRLWQGTASELSKVLGLNLNPRVLSMELKKSEDVLNDHGILIVRKKIHGKHILSISMNSDTHRITHSAIKHIHPMVQHDNFATPIEKETIIFPFEWKYGWIRELTEEEKNELNKPRGKHQRSKPCAICGASEGGLTHKKTSDGNPSFICESCAEQYVLSATRLMEKGME